MWQAVTPDWCAGKATITVQERCRPVPGIEATLIQAGSVDRAAPDRSPSGRWPMAESISRTPNAVDAPSPELPRLVRLALGFGSHLQQGTRDVTRADGRTVGRGGNAARAAA